MVQITRGYQHPSTSINIPPFHQKIIASQLATGALASAEAAAQAEGCPRQFPAKCTRFPTSQGVSKDCSGLTHVDMSKHQHLWIFGVEDLPIHPLVWIPVGCRPAPGVSGFSNRRVVTFGFVQE